MQVQLKRKNDDYLFEAQGANPVQVYIDNKMDVSPQGASPMELLLMAVGGCNAIDIVSILKKQRQQIGSYRAVVTGERHEVGKARPFKSIHVAVHLQGEIDPEKARKAAQMSFEEYCSVSFTLIEAVQITYEVELNGVQVI
ncbi:OsmC family protein [Croceiramulus getboli]|nr:OsmC family protein [Flavobacteriaceae bacterium YJPT1-3]